MNKQTQNENIVVMCVYELSLFHSPMANGASARNMKNHKSFRFSFPSTRSSSKNTKFDLKCRRFFFLPQKNVILGIPPRLFSLKKIEKLFVCSRSFMFIVAVKITKLARLLFK